MMSALHLTFDLPGEYVTLYQLQCDALRSRFAERNTFIGTLLQEKETMQVRALPPTSSHPHTFTPSQEKIRELQGLVKSVLSEHAPPLSPSHRHTPTLPPHTGTPPPPHQHTSSTSALTSPSTSAPSLPPPPPPPPPPSPLPPPPEPSAHRILSLLGELEEVGGVREVGVAPCHCCSGQLYTV